MTCAYNGTISNCAKLIGISGRKRSGKDTFFELLKEHYPEYENKKFAAKCKEVCSLVTGVPLVNFYDGSQYETRLEDWDMTIRQIQQKVGTEMFRNGLSKDTWVKALFSEYDEKNSKWVITDVRFPNEANRIKELGGILIRVVRSQTETNDQHASEISLDDYPYFDHIIYNSGSIENYQKQILKMIKIYT